MFQQIHLVPNPSIFTLNDIIIGVGTADVLLHINSQQFLKRMPSSHEPSSLSPPNYDSTPQSSDPMSLLARHILEQRRFVRRLDRLCIFEIECSSLTMLLHSHIISFYPIYPVPREQSSSVNYDVTHSHLLRIGMTRPIDNGIVKAEDDDQSLNESWDGSAPHILILPSRLKQFYRVKQA